MTELIALGCGVLLGFVGTTLGGPSYWRLLGSPVLPAGPLLRAWLRVQRGLLARAGHHPYLVGSLDALADAADPAALDAARARMRWWAAVRRRADRLA
jgi:hypothetical protein